VGTAFHTSKINYYAESIVTGIIYCWKDVFYILPEKTGLERSKFVAINGYLEKTIGLSVLQTGDQYGFGGYFLCPEMEIARRRQPALTSVAPFEK
jgi:hypothetical protein